MIHKTLRLAKDAFPGKGGSRQEEVDILDSKEAADGYR
jgi:hypothetical protein